MRIDPASLESGLYTMAQAGARLGVSERTARRWAATGEFPVHVHEIAGRYRVSVVALERWLAGEAVAS